MVGYHTLLGTVEDGLKDKTDSYHSLQHSDQGFQGLEAATPSSKTISANTPIKTARMSNSGERVSAPSWLKSPKKRN